MAVFLNSQIKACWFQISWRCVDQCLRKRKFDKEKEFKFHRLDYKSHVS